MQSQQIAVTGFSKRQSQQIAVTGFSERTFEKTLGQSSVDLGHPAAELVLPSPRVHARKDPSYLAGFHVKPMFDLFKQQYASLKNKSDNCSEQIGKSRNLVYALANGYNTSVVTRFVASLRMTGCTADIVLLRDTQLDLEFEQTCNVFLDIVNASLVRSNPQFAYGKTSHHGLIRLRHIALGNYLERNWERYRCGRVLSADFRDAFFQLDPFEFMPNLAQHAAWLADEGALYTNNYQRWAVARAAQCFRGNAGQKYISSLDTPIINIGAMMMKPAAAIIIGKAIFSLGSECNKRFTKTPPDQALLNFLYYSGTFHEMNVPIRVFPAAASPICHLAYARFGGGVIQNEKIKKKYKFSNPVRNELGNVCAIVHMYDRHGHFFETALSDLKKKNCERLGHSASD